MALPSSGSISMSQINQEFGREAGAQISLGSAASGNYGGGIVQQSLTFPSAADPDSMSEFRGYNHSCPWGVTISSTADSISAGQSVTLTATAQKQIAGTANSFSWSTGATGSSITVSPNSTTTYTVTVSTSGCSNVSTTKTISIIPASTTCTPAGTLLGTYCMETQEWGQYADGNCGTYDAMISDCSANCGCQGGECILYDMSNAGEGPIVVQYTNCAGTLRENTIEPGTGFQDCIQDIGINVIEGDPAWLEAKPLGPCGG